MSQYSQNSDASASLRGRMRQEIRDFQEEERERWRRLTLVGSDDECDSEESEGTAEEFREMWRGRRESRRISPNAMIDAYGSERTNTNYQEWSSPSRRRVVSYYHSPPLSASGDDDNEEEVEEHDKAYREADKNEDPKPTPAWLYGSESEYYSDSFVPSPLQRTPRNHMGRPTPHLSHLSVREHSESGSPRYSSYARSTCRPPSAADSHDLSNTYPSRPHLRHLIFSLDGQSDVISDLQKMVLKLRADIRTLRSTEKDEEEMKEERGRQSASILAMLQKEVRLLREGRDKDREIATLQASISALQRVPRRQTVFEEVDWLITGGDEEFVDVLEVEEEDGETDEVAKREEVSEVQGEKGPRVINVGEEIVKLVARLGRGRMYTLGVWGVKIYVAGLVYWWSVCLLSGFAPEF